MTRKNFVNIPPGWVSSKATYKKLGTVIEHLVKNVNWSMYEINLTTVGYQGMTVVRLFPLGHQYGQRHPVWELIWTPSFKFKLVIDPNMLIPNAEW